MATQIRTRQIADEAITNAKIASGAAIATSKLADGASFFKKDGSVAASGAFDMAGNLISNVPTPISSTDAANKAYVDAHGISGSFSLNQIVVGAGSNVFGGSDNFIYDGNLRVGKKGVSTGDIYASNGTNGAGFDFGAKIIFDSPIFGGQPNSHIAAIRGSGDYSGAADNALLFYAGQWNNNQTLGPPAVVLRQPNIGFSVGYLGINRLVPTQALDVVGKSLFTDDAEITDSSKGLILQDRVSPFGRYRLFISGGALNVEVI